MVGQLELRVLLYAVPTIVSALVALAAWTNRDSPGGFPLVVLGVAGSVWPLSYGGAFILGNEAVAHVGLNVAWIASDVSVIAAVYVAAEYTERTWLKRPAVFGSAVGFVVLDATVVVFNPGGLFYEQPPAFLDGNLMYVFGPWWTVHVIGLFTAGMVATGVFASAFRRSSGLYRRQLRAMLGGFALFWLAVLVEVGGLEPYRDLLYNTGMLGSAAMGLTILWALFYADFLDVTPVTRETLLRNMDDAVVAVDDEGRVIDSNLRARNLFELEDDVLGEDASTAFDEFPEFVSQLEARERGVTDLEIRRDGKRRYYDVEFSSLDVVDGPVSGTLAVVRDVTEGRERERRLEEYRQLVESAGDPMYVLDRKGAIRILNDAMADFFGRSKADLVGTAINDLLPDHGIERGREALRTVLSDDNDQRWATYEVETVDSDGTDRVFELTVGAITTDDGEFDGSVVTYREVTERRERERQLTRQNEQLDQFASMVSHDLKNPLGIADMYLGFARESHDEEDFDAVEEAHDRMEAMIGDILTFARTGGTVEDTEEIAVTDLAETAWTNVETPNARLDVAADGVTMAVDPDRFQHVFENLFRNAREHNDDELTVRVTAEHDGDGTLARLSIADDGDGIQEDERDDVFEHGHTTRESGTGFGLSIVETIVEAHSWTVTVGESDDGGARFDIES